METAKKWDICRPLVSGAQGLTETETYTDAGRNLIYDTEDYSGGYAQIRESFRCLSKDDIFPPLDFDHVFIIFNTEDGGIEVGCEIYAPDIRCQEKNPTAAQTMKAFFTFSAKVLVCVFSCTFLFKRLFSYSSDGKRHFDSKTVGTT